MGVNDLNIQGYADDTPLVAENENDLQLLLH